MIVMKPILVLPRVRASMVGQFPALHGKWPMSDCPRGTGGMHSLWRGVMSSALLALAVAELRIAQGAIIVRSQITYFNCNAATCSCLYHATCLMQPCHAMHPV